MSSTNKDYVPILKTKKDITNEVIDTVKEERSGKQLGLKSRFSQLNIALGKFFRFSTVTLLAGLSGHGKSAILNMLLEDFLNKNLNGHFNEDVIIIHNTFEMLPRDEVLRTTSSKVGKSHLALLSAEWIPSNESTGEKGRYNVIDEFELTEIIKAIEEEEDKEHYYFEEPTTLFGLAKNREKAILYYMEKYPNKPRPRVIQAIDHSLLVIGEKGESTLDTMSALGRYAVWSKKRGDMMIILGQLNANIENTERIKNSDLHFPIKSDIYAQGQLYNACDNVLITHIPELLGIVLYGKNKLSTERLLHLQVVKQRFGSSGSIWLKNEFEKGKLSQFKPISHKK